MNRTNYGGIYVHIPFCVNKCNYCDFLSYGNRVFLNGKFGTRDEVVALYVDTLIREINLTNSDEQFDTIYIGGGTPTILDECQLADLLSHIEKCTDVSTLMEYTLEAGRPDTITEEKLAVAKQYGVTRISVNPQSLRRGA